MALTPGSRLGAYEIIGLLGEGGMGQVYRARDTNLGRDVAIKILPESFVADAERLARFEREARTLASLNHPNIAQIYGMEDASANGRALVMELVEGEDLAEILKRGPVALADALPMAQQIAQALEVAHEQGIVHRDLKPANIKVRSDGTVKVLDFGLAKAMEPGSGSSGSLSNSPTMTSPATALGMILGTAAYMSPEQARGKAVDRRADVWAFGVVFYEMLSGKRAFEGSEVTDVLASVLKDTIPLDTLPVDTPPEVRRLLRRCLAKNRADRLDSMATARLEIAEAAGSAGETSQMRMAHATAALPRSPLVPLTLAIAGVVIGLAAGWALFKPGPAPADAAASVVRFPLPLSTDARLRVVAIADDTIVYQADRIYVRRLSDTAAKPVPGTEGSVNLFLSPNGRWAGFFAGDKIKKVDLSGGDPLPIVDTDGDSPGGAWGPNNTVLYSASWSSGLYSVSADGGGKPVAISTVDTAGGEAGHWWPYMMPDDKTALITVWMAGAGINDSKIAALDLATGKHRIIMAGSAARYLASGHLLFFHAGAFQVVPFDPIALRPTGEPVKVLPDAKGLDPLGTRDKPVAISSTGTLVYIQGSLRPESQLTWASARGVFETVAGSPKRWAELSLSSDGRRIVGHRTEGGMTNLWIQDLARQTEQRLDFEGSTFSGIWSPADDALFFTSLRKGNFDSYRLAASEATPKLIIDSPLDQQVRAVAHDGKRIVVGDTQKDGTLSLMMTELDRPEARTRLPIQASTVENLQFSIDDKWLAIQTTMSGHNEVVVMPANGAGAIVPIPIGEGVLPRWSRTDSTLYFQRGDDLVGAIYSTAGGRFTVTREEQLFKLAGHELFGIAPDGRFLLLRNLPGQAPGIQVVVNWLSELKR